MSGDERGFVLPTGTVTFLLSDVEVSTQRWDAAPEAMTVAIPRHYELMDAAIVAHGGVRPVEQGEGDSVVGAFSRASDGVAAAIDVQLAFAAEPWPAGGELRVRMAVHTGEGQVREEGSYVGHTLNRCARMRAAAHGGQVLLSATTAALVADQLPQGAALRDLGDHRLKDLGRAEHIFQLLHPDLPSAFPPLHSLDEFRHNLPVQLTPLIGREQEIADVRRLLGTDRLVTLTGSAGVGKTRLALAVAAALVDRYVGGVWLVELAPLVDPTGVGRAVLATIGAHEGPGLPVAEQLAAAIGDQPSLLVLDNCEHLVATCAELVSELLVANPSASVLATSRELLGVPGEITWRVPSLGCPDPDQRVTIPVLSQYNSVALFIERAHRARPSFVVTEANAPAIAEICHRLDGIPLAIELAAARCRQISAERIAAELEDRFRILTGGARTLMARQQTLAASIDWSYDRLDELEQVTFRRLGVFAGPFPLEAAEAVAAAVGAIDSVEVFDVLSRLVDKSLVVADENLGGELRYRLLESLRAYAMDRARSAGELTACREAHATWWADWLEPRGAMPTDDVVDEIEVFHANLRAALDWSADKPELGLRLLHGLGVAWVELGRAGDAMAAADDLLTDENALHHGDEWLAAAWRTSALYFSSRGPAAELPFLERIESIASQRGDEFYRRLARWPKEPYVTDPAWRRLAGQQGDRYFDAWVPINLARRLAEDDPAAATLVMNEAEAAAAASRMRSLRDLNSLAHAEMACSTGHLSTAIERARALLHGPFFSWWNEAARILSFVALLAKDEEALRCAVDAGEQWLHISPGPSWWAEVGAHRLGLLHGRPSVVLDLRDLPWPTCATLWLVGRESIDAGSAQDAIDIARLWSRPEPHPRATVAAIEAAATGDEERWHDALAVALDRGLRLIAVDALEGLAVAAGRVESWAEGLRLLGAAERLRDETGYRWRFAFEQRTVHAVRADAHNALGEDAARAAHVEGRDLDWRQAADYTRRARGERKRPHHGWASLTPTELQVVALVAEGLTNAQIGDRLFISHSTVKTHLEHIFAKLGVRRRSELAAETARRVTP